MSLINFYSSRIEVFQAIFLKLQKKEIRLSVLRLSWFLASLVAFYMLFSVSVLIASVVLAIGFFSLGWLVKYQNTIIQKKKFNEYLKTINELELKSLNGDFYSFPDGSEYHEKDHPYESDLDIFGHASLFQFVNRTTSQLAGNMLASWLKAPAPISEIQLRQEAVAELKDLTDWRQQMIAIGYQYKESGNNPEEILMWLKTPSIFKNITTLRILTVSLSVISFATAFFVFRGLPFSVLMFVLIVNFWVNYKYFKAINKFHQQVTKSCELLKAYSEAIGLIESQDFHSRQLLELKSNFFGKEKASKQIKKLSELVNRLDTRLNVMVSIPLNLFLFWDIHSSIALESWKKSFAPYVSQWFEAMAKVEALSSLANLQFNNPEWIFPEVKETCFELNAVEMGHPLIPANRRVCNDFSVDRSGKIVLVTGSNMSGKSTFQRTCGVNMVLAFAGAPVCASKFIVSRVSLYTSMRISDSLEDNTSSFYAELKRLALIIKEVESNSKVFLLLDEILRGTNSNDRHIGSIALIKQLIQQNASGIVATHDLSLSSLEQELPDNIDNYNFDVKINGEELYFDYKLNKGICKSLNASILMKKMGIKV